VILFLAILTMKTTLILTVIAGASAFAPASQSARSTQLAAADIGSLRGVGPETGGKVVSSTARNRTHPYATVINQLQREQVSPMHVTCLFEI
jgi:hypothetical protein